MRRRTAGTTPTARRPDPDAAALQVAARSIGRQIVVASAAVVVAALALTIAWVLHQSVPAERLEQVAAASQGEVFVSATDVVAGLVVLGLAGVVFAGLVSVVIARRAVRPLGDALRLQRRFVADASHELRTPLAVLDARLQALERRIDGGAVSADARVASDVAHLRRDSRALIDIVGDLLEAVGGGDGGGDADADAPPVVGVDAVVAEVLSSMTVLADEREIRLERVAAGEEAQVAVPRTSLRRSVLALVDNALGHAPAGSTVVVTVRVEGRGPSAAVVVAVADRGSGITGIDPSRVFDRFARAEPTEGSSPGGGRPGFGIGLALVREVAGRHGGDVRVASTSGAGTTIEVTLPLAHPAGG
ncbi:HAMP domain-containing histidine kinase [Frigoribacterium sp. VKM Ac-1396]|uniref:sensor histidine kinase n=1 Tax=Frigoribacterium sp. VKM Ac-1396 TaxID=2783821 RepID=UPI00188AE2E5|nr:HAMP domain-containing histidine kinase [Frigoribacterium sp. VKM Ac-1396]